MCRQHADKSELLRLVKTQQGIILDKTGKIDGRGVYVHSNRECIETCIKKQSLNGAFKQSVAKEVYDEYEARYFHDKDTLLEDIKEELGISKATYRYILMMLREKHGKKVNRWMYD